MSDLTNEPLGAGRVESRELDQEVRTSFLDYAMSVIVSRALPDVRDGLKPVHRRVLYAMYDGGYRPDRGYFKCARVVGDVMGNYHPHGDSAIYDALVRLAQPFSMRYPLIDGQGYFGSVDGDPAGAMRYTECRLSRMATELLRDIEASAVRRADLVMTRSQRACELGMNPGEDHDVGGALGDLLDPRRDVGVGAAGSSGGTSSNVRS